MSDSSKNPESKMRGRRIINQRLSANGDWMHRWPRRAVVWLRSCRRRAAAANASRCVCCAHRRGGQRGADRWWAIVLRLSAARLRPRAPEAQSGRRAGEAGLDLVQKLITLQDRAHPGPCRTARVRPRSESCNGPTPGTPTHPGHPASSPGRKPGTGRLDGHVFVRGRVRCVAGHRPGFSDPGPGRAGRGLSRRSPVAGGTGTDSAARPAASRARCTRS